MARRELPDLVRRDIGPVGDRIVVEHAGERRRLQYGAQMRARFPAVAAIDIRRQHHETAGSRAREIARQRNRIRSRVRGDSGHDRHPATCGANAGADDVHSFQRRQRGRLAEGTERDDTRAAGADEPIDVLAKRGGVHRQCFIEGRRDRGHDAAPVVGPHQAAASGMPHRNGSSGANRSTVSPVIQACP